jgi:SSS family solute:Na+ symporter
MDIYSQFKPNKSQHHYVFVGRVAAFSSLCIALVVSEPLLGKFDQAFQYIQEFTGFFTPGIVVIFMMGMFWKRATSAGALSAALGSAVLSLVLKFTWPELPFMDRVGLVFLLCLALCYVVSIMGKAPQENSSVSLDEVSFDTGKPFNIAAIGVILILTALYATWW